MNQLKKIFATSIIALICSLIPGYGAMKDMEIIETQSQTIKDDDGEVTVRLDWLNRPGEMAITVFYNGYLTQEGLTNLYICVNGENRDFVTMKKELKNRAQKLRIISFHPTVKKDGVNRLAKIPNDSIVDGLLFKNAPYYKQFGDVDIELKFFCHGRWDGDGNKNNENYHFKFSSSIKGFVTDHF
ncbi:MAG: hypothetical protein ACQETH_00510 [Candidatus Rifleibacteriota bacterium]